MTQSIKIDGNVKDAKTNAAIKGVSINARQKSNEIKTVTDDLGNYSLRLSPGNWRISASAEGYDPTDPFMMNFAADTSGIDFTLNVGYTISGVVFDGKDGIPAPGAIIEAKATIGGIDHLEQVLTDANGNYQLSSLKAGKWDVKASLGRSRTETEERTLGPDAKDVNLILTPKMKIFDWGVGIVFFVVLVYLLITLTGLYLWSHKRFPAKTEPELTVLLDQVEQARELASRDPTIETGSQPISQTLRTSVSTLKDNWDGISGSIITLTEGQVKQVDLLLSTANTAAGSDNIQQVGLALETISSVLENSRSLFLWSQQPWSFLEVLFWSLAGIIVSLLITSGYYLRSNRFYAEGIWMHLSHLVGVPLLVLVVVFLISQIKLSIQIDQSEVTLNINDPRLLAAISFIIAVRPWVLLDFVKEAGASVFTQFKSRFGGGGGDSSEDK